MAICEGRVSTPSNCMHCRIFDLVLAMSPRDPGTGRTVVVAQTALTQLAWVMADIIAAASEPSPDLRGMLRDSVVAELDESIEHAAVEMSTGGGGRLANVDVVQAQ